MKPSRPLLALTMGTMLLLPVGAATAASAAPAGPAAPPADHSRVVGEQPVHWTPHVLDGTVKDILRIGDTVVAAGDFSKVAEAGGGRTRSVHNLFAFEHGTGRIVRGFSPSVDGTVVSLAPGPGGTVVIGGEFGSVNGRASQGLARLSLRDGRSAPWFRASLDGGTAHRIASDGEHLYVGGGFSGVNGVERTALARLDARTGSVDEGFAPRVSDQRRGSLRVHELALSPDGRRLVVNGTFTKVDGEDRYQIAMIDTADGSLTPWSTSAYEADCDYSLMQTYMRQMDFSPDGSYFAVVTAGGPEVKPGLCKSAARFENTDTPDSEPTWSNKTGGDSLYSVEITSSAVYVGGHQRWMDNPEGALNPGPGSVAREGIAAVDPGTGKALAWNPGRARGHGVEALHATSDGLYVGSDTERLADEYHARLGMFPLS
ncbi:delta-60 repeat domain-containing protein [Nocardiopsis quinghaiensis]|uniref:delta-60 repeat domain-containing protein n=1 Tax=Nocardiopsis quinghaiensis TaxID=464995 RepID=UPI00123BD1B0|nr:delta-60 repeat domain-containing protein [Nocardiopsis quinghaiensis]